MAKSSKLKISKKRVKVEDLPTPEKKLSGKHMKKVKGGYELKNVQVTSVTSKKTVGGD